MNEIDDIDKKIIKMLQAYPNISHKKIASKVGRTQPTVGVRTKRMENLGILQKTYGINFKKYNRILFIIRLNIKNIDLIHEIKKEIGVLNIFKTIGEYNLIILYSPNTLDEGYNFIHNFKKKIKGRIDYEIVSSILKDFIHPLKMKLND
jgi:DNA-binding Lrp family transcriptional regulator